MKSVMKHQFSNVPQAKIQRSSFDRSHGHKTTFDGGDLIPIFVDEALPGDTFNLNMTAFARLATPIKPIMDNMYMETFFFAVPIRLLWENWQRFNGEQDSPNDSTDFTIPQMNQINPAVEGSLADHFGLPTGVGGIFYSAFWHRAYNLIYNEWFRDQNLQTPAVENIDDGDDADSEYPVRKRGKRHDYFTSCLPWPQKGVAAGIPLGGTAPVLGITDGAPIFIDPTGVNTATPLKVEDLSTYIELNLPQSGAGALQWSDPQLYADLGQAESVDVNDLRRAFQVQKMLERDARSGTRYTEVIRAHFGVTSPDSRLQRPEYLGGGSSPVNISPVQQTNATASDVQQQATPQGNLAAMGTAQLHNHGFTKSFTEHCVVLGLINVRADLTYQQGINRMWSRKTRYDYYWPSLAHIGEQAVLQQEIYAIGGPDDTTVVFGYQERFAEYRYKPSTITGKFRSTDPESLDIWHLSQEFASPPTLNSTFIEDNPPIDRIIAVPSEPQFLFDSYFSLKCARPMPLYGVPGNIDRF